MDVDSQESDPWAQLLVPLWQKRTLHSFKVEREFNRRLGLQPPYCAVCSFFHTYEQVQTPRRRETPPSFTKKKQHKSQSSSRCTFNEFTAF